MTMPPSPSVGVVCHFPPPPGGMAVQAQALVSGLRSEGIDAIPIPTNLGSGALASRIERVWILRTMVRFPVFLVRLVLAMPRIGILHVNGCSGLAFFLFAAPAILLGRLCGRSAILHYHGGAAKEFFRNAAPAAPWVFRRATSVIVPSRYLREVFEEWKVCADVIPNICDLRRFGAPQPPPAPVFVVARSLEAVYDIETAIRAFAIFVRNYPAAQLRIAGDGPQMRMLRQLAQSLGVSGSVQFLGSVDNALIPEVLSGASAFLNTSLVDNQPVSIIEAFAAGVPVISSNVGGVPDPIAHSVTGLLFRARDVGGLVEHMILIADHPGTARQLADHARATAERFSWPAVFRQLRRVYGLNAATVAA